MLFPLPPPDVITHYHRAFTLIEETAAVYQLTARKALELADALHNVVVDSGHPWGSRPLVKVARLKSGTGSESSLPPALADPTVDVIAPRDLYDLPVPHVHRFRLTGPARDGAVHPPGTLMLSTRSDGAHIAVSSRAATPSEASSPCGPWTTRTHGGFSTSSEAGARRSQNSPRARTAARSPPSG
ncbi:hypothetical protein [Streptomyces sp. I6]|uniref:hypothetical protein n=1 Tax=Streptomyces sp. I6 TaxID=2483113 RepID=UPI0028808628|nr:hypothetical protein [Streptomyces sp. I6]